MTATLSADALYTVHLLPTDTKDERLLTLLANKYTQLRIRGLEQSPQSFSATIEGERALTQEERIARVCVPHKRILVAVLVGDENGATETSVDLPWYERTWVAQATLLGPHSWQEHVAPFVASQGGVLDATFDRAQLTPAQLEQTTLNAHHDGQYWHMTALYVDQDHRRRGLAKKVCEYAFRICRESSLSELRIIIKPTNTIVIEMYESLGFVNVSKINDASSQPPFATLAEATVAAGDGTTLPKDFARQALYTSRMGLIVIKQL